MLQNLELVAAVNADCTVPLLKHKALNYVCMAASCAAEPRVG